MSTIGALKEKARAVDKWFTKRASWWPTYEQTKKAYNKLPKNTVKMGSPKLYEVIDRAISGPKNVMKRKDK